MRTFTKELLTVKVYPNRKEMGVGAASDAIAQIKKLLSEKEEVNIIFAAAPSQDDFFEELIKDKSIEWERVNAFHMDEYIGLSKDAPQAFGNFLNERLFNKLALKNIYLINGEAEDTEAECKRYEKLLAENPVDIVCLGIGENGHIAFNDPPYADFNDDKMVKIIRLDDVSRQQQVNDKCFVKIEDVPREAYTLTIPALLKGDFMYCIVPTALKAEAVYKTIYEEINPDCPSSILRTKENAVLYLDKDSASLLNN